ncbi:MAG: S1C family serine protease [Candidatus Saccharimonadales bacterium]
MNPDTLPPIQKQPEQQPKHTDNTSKQRIMALALIIIFSTSFGFLGGYFGDRAQKTGGLTGTSERRTVSSQSELITQLVKEVGPSVVSIDVTSQGVRRTFSGNRAVEQRSAGTGIIIDTNGTIITNRHVIPAGASAVSITLSDGTQLDNVEVLGRTNDNDTLDIAFLKITDKKGKELKPAKIGDSSKVEVGQDVVAIGNALGQFQNTVTSGIISGYGRSVKAGGLEGGASESLQNLFQTDAAINEGNSGGPLVNLNGEVIGINTAIAGDGAQNVGFAIPINDVKGLITSVLRDGKLLRPYLGVRYVTLNDDAAFEYSLETKRGAYVAPGEGGSPSIIPNSPAAKAGIREGDIITKVNNDSINEMNSLVSLLGRHSVGDKVTLTIIRDGKDQPVDATLEAAPQN